MHVVPVDDLIGHTAPPVPSSGISRGWAAVEELPGDDLEDCPCGTTTAPVEDPATGSIGWIVTHHSLDGRELAQST